MNPRCRIAPAVPAVLIALMAAVAAPAPAAEPAAPLAPAAPVAPLAPPPAAIATVDLLKLVDKLNEKSDWEMQINALVSRISAENNDRRKALEELKKQAEAAPEKDRAALIDKLTIMQLELQRWASIKLAEVDREKAFMWMAIYRSIRSEAAKLAAADGYDLVLVNDGVTELQLQQGARVSQEQQAQEQIMRRRVLFANGSIDVTDKLILRMNNAHKASGGAGAAPESGGAAPSTRPAPAAPPGTAPASPSAAPPSTPPSNPPASR